MTVVVRFARRAVIAALFVAAALGGTLAGVLFAYSDDLPEVTALDNLSYGLGLLARIREGSTVTLIRERIDDNIWLPTSLKFKADGRALLGLRKLTIDFSVEWFDYRRT